MNKKEISILALGALVLSGCANRMENPYLADITTYGERVKIMDESRKDEITKVSYLSRFLMESDNRGEITNIIEKSDINTSWLANTSATSGTDAQMYTDLVVGDFNSGVGHQVGAAVFSAGLVLDGSKESISTAWVPTMVDGVVIETKEQAEKALADFSFARVKRIAKIMNWQVECVGDCSANFSRYLFTNPDNANPLHDDYVYKPSMFYVRVFWGGLKAVEPTDPIHALMGQTIGWETTGHDGYQVDVYSGIKFDENGELVRRQTENDDRDYISARKDMFKTMLGRNILQEMNSTPLTIYGSADVHPNTILYNGKAYSYFSNSSTKIASYDLVNPYYLDGQAPVTTLPDMITPIVD